MPRCLAMVLLILLPAVAAGESLRLEAPASPTGVHRLRLSPELGETWREVAVTRLEMRGRGGVESLRPAVMPASATLAVRLPRPECSLLVAEIGAAAGRSPDGRRGASHSSKIVSCRGAGGPASLAERLAAAPLLTAKTGTRAELRPLFNPATLGAGFDLALRLYFKGEPVRDAGVTARSAEGAVASAVSDRVGIATLRLPSAGAWVASFTHRGATAELHFEVFDE